MRILYVEDNPNDADLTRRALTREMPESTVDVEPTLESARARLGDGSGYDVVLTDLNLPDGNGLDLLAEIREKMLPVAVVVLTSAGDETTAIAALKAGADDYISKRMDYLGRLPQTLEGALARFQSEIGRRAHRLNVLYAEHTTADIDLAQRHMARHARHIHFEAVSSVPEMLKRLAPGAGKAPFDVLLLDYRMPGMNALEILKSLREEHHIEIPVVLVTGHGDEETAAGALRLGASDYLIKHPGYLFQLQAAIENAYHQAEIAREHEALRASEARFRLLAENAQDIVFRLSLEPQMTFEYVSPSITTVTGYAPVELYDNAELLLEIVHPDDQPQLTGSLIGLAPVGMAFAMRFRPKKGDLIWIELRTTLISDDDGKPLAVEGIARDVTGRKKAEEELLFERDRVQQYLDVAGVLLMVLNTDAEILLMNKRGCEIIEYDETEILGKNWIDTCLPEAIRADLRGTFVSLISGDPERYRYVENEVLTKSGAHKMIAWTNTILRGESGEIVGILSSGEDITERKRLEQAEREERALTEALLDTAAAINSTLDLEEVLAHILENVEKVIAADGSNIMLVDPDKDVLRVVACSKSYGLHNFKEPVIGTQYPMWSWETAKQMIETSAPLAVEDTRKYPGWHVAQDGEWIRAYAGAAIKIGGLPMGIVSLDSATPGAFTERDAVRLQAFADQAAIAIQNARLFEELAAHNEGLEVAVAERTSQLNNTAERVEAILNNSPDAILLLDSKARIDAANPAFYRVFDTPIDSFHARPVHDLVVPESVENVRDAVHLVAVKSKTMRLEVAARRADDSTFPADMALAAIRDDGKTAGIVCILRDITESKEVEALKDQFVSNVSHELRTPITSLKLNHRLLIKDPEKAEVYISRLGREIDRLNALIEDILRLSRLDQAKIELQLEPIDLNELVAQHVDDRTPIAESRDLKLSAKRLDNLPLVQADSTLLGQALSVLLTNAMNYTPEGGSIVVSTALRPDGPQTLVGFEVYDTGPGVPQEDRGQLFTRFFRGKIGRDSGMPGTGLGLSIAREIVQRHGGKIEVGDNKDAGSGAVFSVWLPAK